MYRNELSREPHADRVAAQLATFPSAVAEDGGSLVGFCYTVNFAPDVLELANIVVAENRRNEGLGGILLQHVESQAAQTFAGIILVNSDLYPQGKTVKRPATDFYHKHGYRILTATAGTRIFFKDLK
ncbi:acetyltransferase (GNAT) family protein [Oryzihumus leptocrescens]|uniref:Acetyltransferase (GNAT) family protein n=2 Tax=Oryzihumus leptocrescens TaxID=297536 RepID=A0A542ZFX9_9MICO|nr:acetyltransferase (GNAT) family protein [Oryzihumus leptocrescens]